MAIDAISTQQAGKAVKVEHCHHCNEVCNTLEYHIDDKHFCCSGCQTVFEILHANDLCDFYVLDKNAGATQKNRRDERAYAWLDDVEIQEQLLEFNNGQTAQVTFYLPQMHCVSCIWLLENFYKLNAGVTHSRVNFLKKTATIQFDPKATSLRSIAAGLAAIGYAPEINLADVDSPKKKVITRRLALQIAVAGFAFGNIMLFSFPEYVGMDAETFRLYADIFGYLSIALAIPVLLFSARDYFISAWQGVKSRYLNIDIPLCLALGSLFGRSIYEILTKTGAGYLDSFAGLTFLLLIGKWFQQRTWNQLSFERDYKSYFPVAATVKAGAEEKILPINRLVPGDIIIVHSQEIIPADGILLKGGAQIDYSFVTGESEPVQVQSGERVYAGGRQTGPAIEISLTRRVAQSQLTRLWNDLALKEKSRQTADETPVTFLADQAGKIFSWIILVVGGGAMAYWWGLHNDMQTAINAFTAVMIVACPCTLALSIPFTLGNIMRMLGRKQFYLKNIGVLERLAQVNRVVFDKTGTITLADQAPAHYEGRPLNFEEKSAIRSLVRQSTHPLSRLLYKALTDIPVEMPSRFAEVAGLGIEGVVGGRKLKIGSAEFTGSPQKGSGVHIQIDGDHKGVFIVKSQYRPGLTEVLTYFRTDFIAKRNAAGATPSAYLISGDQDREAAALAGFFPESGAMRFNQSPQDKLAFVKELQKNGKVLMIGDGLNDAGALLQSDVGIVVTENTNNFTPACDAIVHAGSFEHLPTYVQLARDGIRIVHASYLVAFTYNVIGLTYAVSGQLSPLIAAILMPVSSVSIVLFGITLSNMATRRRLKQLNAETDGKA